MTEKLRASQANRSALKTERSLTWSPWQARKLMRASVVVGMDALSGECACAGQLFGYGCGCGFPMMWMGVECGRCSLSGERLTGAKAEHECFLEKGEEWSQRPVRALPRVLSSLSARDRRGGHTGSLLRTSRPCVSRGDARGVLESRRERGESAADTQGRGQVSACGEVMDRGGRWRDLALQAIPAEFLWNTSSHLRTELPGFFGMICARALAQPSGIPFRRMPREPV